jgi:hypothetical protein
LAEASSRLLEQAFFAGAGLAGAAFVGTRFRSDKAPFEQAIALSTDDGLKTMSEVDVVGVREQQHAG